MTVSCFVQIFPGFPSLEYFVSLPELSKCFWIFGPPSPWSPATTVYIYITLVFTVNKCTWLDLPESCSQSPLSQVFVTERSSQKWTQWIQTQDNLHSPLSKRNSADMRWGDDHVGKKDVHDLVYANKSFCKTPRCKYLSGLVVFVFCPL